MAGLKDFHARLVRLAVGERRIGRHEDELMRMSFGAASGEKGALSEVGVAELTVNAPEIQARRESQRPVGCLLNWGVPRESQPARAPHCGAAQDGGQGLGRLLNHVYRLVNLIKM